MSALPAQFEDSSGTIRLSGHIDGFGLTDDTDANAGAEFVFATPFRLGAAGPTVRAGTGAPGVGGNLGDLYIRTDGDCTASTYLYACTTAGIAGAAVWTALVTA